MLLGDAVKTVIELLYPGDYWGTWPGTRSVTLILAPFAGVAYTRGTLLDDDHKEIHLSTDYVAAMGREVVMREVTGVVVHEMVHCWQWNGCGTAPGGLVEGIADWVRLRADLAPPHWKRRTSGDRGWDAGYQITAWFLDWLHDTYGPDTVPRLNHVLKETEYEEGRYWTRQCGFPRGVQELWEEYKTWLADKEHVRNEHEHEHEREHEKDANKEDQPRADRASERPGDENCCNPAKSQDEGAESELDSGWTELSSGALELKEPINALDPTLT